MPITRLASMVGWSPSVEPYLTPADHINLTGKASRRASVEDQQALAEAAFKVLGDAGVSASSYDLSQGQGGIYIIVDEGEDAEAGAKALEAAGYETDFDLGGYSGDVITVMPKTTSRKRRAQDDSELSEGDQSFSGNVDDEEGFLALVDSQFGWAVKEQAQNIIDGDDYGEQNSNALKNILQIAKSREPALAESLESYFSDEPNKGLSARKKAQDESELDAAVAAAKRLLADGKAESDTQTTIMKQYSLTEAEAKEAVDLAATEKAARRKHAATPNPGTQIVFDKNVELEDSVGEPVQVYPNETGKVTGSEPGYLLVTLGGESLAAGEIVAVPTDDEGDVWHIKSAARRKHADGGLGTSVGSGIQKAIQRVLDDQDLPGDPYTIAKDWLGEDFVEVVESNLGDIESEADIAEFVYDNYADEIKSAVKSYVTGAAHKRHAASKTAAYIRLLHTLPIPTSNPGGPEDWPAELEMSEGDVFEAIDGSNIDIDNPFTATSVDSGVSFEFNAEDEGDIWEEASDEEMEPTARKRAQDGDEEDEPEEPQEDDITFEGDAPVWQSGKEIVVSAPAWLTSDSQLFDEEDSARDHEAELAGIDLETVEMDTTGWNEFDARIQETEGYYVRKSGEVFATIEEAIKAHMQADGFFPNVWNVSDHGNAHLVSLGKRSSRKTAGGYAWKITKVFTEHGLDAADEGKGNSVGDGVWKSTIDSGEGEKFRLKDDDGNVYYEGLYASAGGAVTELAFVPLDDFGMPNAGCTAIEYFRNGTWETL